MPVRGTIAAQMSVPGVMVQVLDYRWDVGEQITECEHDFIVSYRSYPPQVSVAARVKERAIHFGQLMFFPSDLLINTGPAYSSERVRNIRCRFDPQRFAKVWNTLGEGWDAERLSKCFDVRNLRIEQAMQRLGMEITNPGFASQLMIESTSNIIAIEIARYLNEPKRDLRVRTHGGKLTEQDLFRIYEYVQNMENRSPSIQEIADLCDISPAHLRRSFKNSTGRTVHEYVDDIRLKRAKLLLVDTDLPLKEVSFRLGFANSSTFSSTFKKVADETPSNYRYRHRHQTLNSPDEKTRSI